MLRDHKTLVQSAQSLENIRFPGDYAFENVLKAVKTRCVDDVYSSLIKARSSAAVTHVSLTKAQTAAITR